MFFYKKLSCRRQAAQCFVSLNISLSHSRSFEMTPLSRACHDVDNWLKASRLRVNASMTQVMWLGSSQQLQRLNVPHVNILSTRVDVVDTACYLGVIIDSQLSLSAQVAALSRSCYFQLRQLCPIIRSLTMEAAKTIPKHLSHAAWTIVIHCFTVFLSV